MRTSTTFPYQVVAEDSGGVPHLLRPLGPRRVFRYPGGEEDCIALDIFPPLGFGFCETRSFKYLRTGTCVLSRIRDKNEVMNPEFRIIDPVIWYVQESVETKEVQVFTLAEIEQPRRTIAYRSVEVFLEYIHSEQSNLAKGGRLFSNGREQDTIISEYLSTAESMAKGLAEYNSEVLGWW
jgi:hypothetical protein